MHTHRLGNGIVVDLGEALRSLVLLPPLLAAAGRGGRASGCTETAPAPPLAVAVAGCGGPGLGLGGGELGGRGLSLGRGRDGGRVRHGPTGAGEQR